MKDVLAIQSTVPVEVTQSLEKAALDFIPKAKFKPYLRQNSPLEYTDLVCCPYTDLTNISINSAGVCEFPNGISHRTNGIEEDETEKLSGELPQAIALAFQVVYQDMERILNKDMKNSSHLTNLFIRIYKTGKEPGSGPWHSDGHKGKWDVPMTSLVYFLHEGCDALISLSEFITFMKDEDKPFASISTKSGMSITFANRVLSHRVHDVKPIPGKNESFRGLLSFFYRGPAGLPPQISALREREWEGYKVVAEEECTSDNRGMTVYSKF